MIVFRVSLSLGGTAVLFVLRFRCIQFEHQAQLVCVVRKCRHPWHVTPGTMTGPASVINLVIRCHFVLKRRNNRLVEVEREETRIGRGDKSPLRLFYFGSMSTMSDGLLIKIPGPLGARVGKLRNRLSDQQFRLHVVNSGHLRRVSSQQI